MTAKLKELSQRQGVTSFMTMLAVWDVLLYRYSGHQDLTVGTPITGRTRTETEGLIGFFVNTLVLRGDLSGRPNFAQLLPRVRQKTLEPYAHQDVPFDRLAEELQPERDPSRSPLFPVLFVMQNAPISELEMDGVKLQVLNVASETAKFDMTLELSESWETEGAILGILKIYWAVPSFLSSTYLQPWFRGKIGRRQILTYIALDSRSGSRIHSLHLRLQRTSQGIMVEHRALRNTLKYLQLAFGSEPGDVSGASKTLLSELAELEIHRKCQSKHMVDRLNPQPVGVG